MSSGASSPSSTMYVTAASHTPSPSPITTPPSASNNQVLDVKWGNILYEGECRSRAVRYTVSCNYYLIGCVCISCACCCYYLGECCGEMAAQSWRLYLTKSAVHYTWHGVYNFPLCDRRKWTIPLADIQDISARKDSTTIVIEIEPKDVYCYSGKPCSTELTSITVTDCQNATCFVEAVKEQLELLHRQ